MSSYDDEKDFNKYLDARKDNNSKHNKTLRDKLKEIAGNVKFILDLDCRIG